MALATVGRRRTTGQYKEKLMMSALRKLSNNFAPLASMRTLGPTLGCRYLATGLASLPRIVRERNIRMVDRDLGRHARVFYREGRRFVYDCAFADTTLRADEANNYAFGIAREIYLRDCYFRYLPPGTFASARTVVDIGSNRGAFSCMMTPVAAKIVAVEALPELAGIIRHNLHANGFGNFVLETAFLGNGGELDGPGFDHLSMDELFRRHGLDHIDLMKMDIEGSEFSLFSQPGWLHRVAALTMEVHPDCGDPSAIVACLQSQGFETRAADENLKLLSDARRANFIYAWKARPIH
jgi:hypothetical protein